MGMTRSMLPRYSAARIAQGISTTYCPKSDRTIGALAVKYGWAMGRDALTNFFREFGPDIATHVLHRDRNFGRTGGGLTHLLFQIAAH
jgi:hypothetical protein